MKLLRRDAERPDEPCGSEILDVCRDIFGIVEGREGKGAESEDLGYKEACLLN